MRSRPTARAMPPAPLPPTNGQPQAAVDADELKKQQAPPRKSKFRLPPPPKLSFANGGESAHTGAAAVSRAKDHKDESASKDEELGGSSAEPITSSDTRAQLSPPPPVPIPTFQQLPAGITSAYQRKQSTSVNYGDEDTPNALSTNKSHKSLPHNNPYQNYKPSTSYAHSRRIQKMQQRFQNAFLILVALLSLSILYWNLHHMHHEQHRHNHNHHHHNTRMKDQNHLHAMIGIIDNPAGFALYSDPIHDKHIEQKDLLFSKVPTVTMSNGRLLPQVGFGVAGRHIEHKDIPLIVSRLLQYASSENEGGGGIAMIDAVMDEDVSVVGDEEKLESSLGKTAVAVVGRAVNFFAKEGNRALQEMPPKGKESKDKSYDYQNRLEVHLIVSLTGFELGKDNTLKALGDLAAELDGLVPPIRDMDNLDVAARKANAVDRRVDTRLHVLLKLPACFNDSHAVVPCALEEEANISILQKWIDSWGVLEKLYEANILHGIGVDGTTEGDLNLLLNHCSVVPLLYRGDVSQALDGYGRKMGVHSSNEYLHVEGLLRDKNITFLASNVAGHVLEKKERAPNAYALMQMLGKVLYNAHREILALEGGSSQAMSNSEQDYYSVPRLALAYLVRHGVVGLPHAYKPEHLVDDSPESVGGLAEFLSERRIAEIGAALKALVTGEDLNEEHGLGTEDEDAIAVVFHNEMGENVEIVHHSASDNHYRGNGIIEMGDSNVFLANTGDQFEVYHLGRMVGKHTVQAEKGGADDFIISPSTLDK